MQSHYSLPLVMASYAVAVAAAYCALDLGGRIALFAGQRQRGWLLCGALAIGTGIWSMHFVGMQALQLPMVLRYDLSLTVLSWLAAVVVSLLALYTISRRQLSGAGIVGSSLLMGLGICVMHLSGMWAMLLRPQIGYDLPLLTVSALIAVAASAAALLICFNIRRLPDGRLMPVKVAAAAVMGGAICGLHYSGMEAARIAQGAVCAADNVLSGAWLGWPVAMVSAAFLFGIVVLSRLDGRAQTCRERVVRERAEAETMRSQLARRRDPWTGLADGKALEDAVTRLLTTAKLGTTTAFEVVYAQLRDHWDLVERFGRTRVDEVLQTLAAGLSSTAQPDECVARPSAETIAMLVIAQPNRPLSRAVDEVAARLGTAVLIRGQAHRFSWELSSRRFPDHGDSMQALLPARSRESRPKPAALTGTASRYAAT
jgi:NO-binding membrane sensor protein with MHYT domain/GGDEF domain-containing protein